VGRINIDKRTAVEEKKEKRSKFVDPSATEGAGRIELKGGAGGQRRLDGGTQNENNTVPTRSVCCHYFVPWHLACLIIS
jgi:hypothetical protein